MRRVAWFALLAGCDRLLGLGPINQIPGDGAMADTLVTPKITVDLVQVRITSIIIYASG